MVIRMQEERIPIKKITFRGISDLKDWQDLDIHYEHLKAIISKAEKEHHEPNPSFLEEPTNFLERQLIIKCDDIIWEPKNQHKNLRYSVIDWYQDKKGEKSYIEVVTYCKPDLPYIE